MLPYTKTYLIITLFSIIFPLDLWGDNKEQVGRTIHQIKIEKLHAIKITTPREMKKKHFFRWLSPITSDAVIVDYAPFKASDKVTAQEVAQFEKRLSKLPYFKQVTVTSQPHQGNKKKIDLLISTKDAFPLTITNIFPVTIVHNNVLGWGHILRNQLFFYKKLGYKLQYDLPNSKGIFTVGGQLYTYKSDKDHYSFSYKNLWFRKDFNIGAWNELQNRFLFMAGSYIYKHCKKRPEVSKNKNRIYHHHQFIVGKLGTKNEAYYKSEQIYHLGEKEEIPCGSSLHVTYGYQLGEYINRPYLGINLSKGGWVPCIGHVYGNIACGSFLYQGKLEQSILKTTLGYFTPLFKVKLQHFRYFINATYLTGYHRLQHEGLGLKEAKDPEEIKPPSPKGDIRININIESVWFTPIMLYDSKIAFLGFIDLVALQDKNHHVLNSNFCQALGFGIKLGNIHIKTGYCPITKENMGIQIGWSTPLLHNFNRNEPGIVPYY